MEHLAKHAPATRARFWIELGAGEGLNRYLSSRSGYLAAARRLRDVLHEAGFRSEDRLHYAEIDGVFHDEQAWAGRMEPLLEYFFPAGENDD